MAQLRATYGAAKMRVPELPFNGQTVGSLDVGSESLYGGQVLKNGNLVYEPRIQFSVQPCEDQVGSKMNLGHQSFTGIRVNFKCN